MPRFLTCFKDPIRALELKIGFLKSEKIIIWSLESEKSGPLESEKRVPTSSYRVPNIFLKKNLAYVHCPNFVFIQKQNLFDCWRIFTYWLIVKQFRNCKKNSEVYP